MIKCVQIITRTLLLRTKLGSSTWGHAVLYAATLIRIRPTALHTHSPLQLVFGHEPNISHLRIFGCAVQVLLHPHKGLKWVPNVV